MNRYTLLVCLLSTLCIHDSYGITTARKSVLRGRVLYPGASRLIESGSKVIVQLQDTSLADAPARVISQFNSSATRFPIAFALKYSPSTIVKGFTYSLSVRIVNSKNDLLYINDVYTPVTLIGADRTKSIDVSVIRVKQPASTVVSKTQWPELVGMTGEQAVKIIKQETGFQNVMTVLEGSPVTLDYRMDRVRVFVDTKGIVRNTPTVG